MVEVRFSGKETASGLRERVSVAEEEWLHEQLITLRSAFSALVATAIPILSCLAVVNLARARYLAGCFVISMGLLLAWSSYRTRRGLSREAEYGFYRSVIRGLIVVFLLYLMYDIGVEGRLSRIQWSYLFPVMAFLFLGKKEGLCWSAAFLVAMFVLLGSTGAEIETTDFKLRYAMSVFVLSVVAFCGQYALEVTYFRFVRQQRDLRDSEEDLRRSHTELEVRVRERTAKLEEAVMALRTANRAKSDFLANMSHEFRTPLNHILGFTELLVDRRFGELNPVQEEYLLDVLHSSRHLLSLVNDVLDLSKVEAGKMELELSEVDLRVVLEGSMVMVGEKAMKHAIRLSMEAEGVPEVVRVDERKLKQVMYNLLSNAVKFTPDGGAVVIEARPVTLTDDQWPAGGGDGKGRAGGIGFRPLPKGRCVEICVRDTGVGIAEGDLERIFEPFEQGDNSIARRYQGTGLGLSLTRRLVELHGGAIRAESEGVGEGSAFRLILPLENIERRGEIVWERETRS